MAKGRETEGLNEILNNLNKEIEGIENRTWEGLWVAGLMLQRESQKNLKDSVVTGNLRASAYTRTFSKFVRTAPSKYDWKKCAIDPSGSFPGKVEVGFTALYAIYVHEDIEKNYRTPKFMEKAIVEIKDDMIQEIQKRAKVKP